MHAFARLLVWATASIVVASGAFFEVVEGLDPLRASQINSKADPFLGVHFKSGYVQVGRKSELFYWYFPHREPVSDNAPWLIWLTGGPGCASTLAAVMENGPVGVDKMTGKPFLNSYGWDGIGDLVFIDQPAGSGFSIAGDPTDYVRTEREVVQDLREFLRGFLDQFPLLRNRPFFITGESYAGHYIPVLANSLLQQPLDGINLKGVAIGNGWVFPKVQYASMPIFGADNGLISIEEKAVISKVAAACGEMIDRKFYDLAFTTCESMAVAIQGHRNEYDVRQSCKTSTDMCYNTTAIDNFFNSPAVQKRLGVKFDWQECNGTVYDYLHDDFLSDVMQDVLEVANFGLPLLIYSGNQDLVCNVRGGLDWLLQLNWRGKEEFSRASIIEWAYDGQTRGLIKAFRNLAFLQIADAGHMVPMDQPISAFGMLEQFVAGKLAPQWNDEGAKGVETAAQHFMPKQPMTVDV